MSTWGSLEELASAVILGVILLAALVQITQRRKTLAHPEPMRGFGWLADIFREDLQIIRRCPWLFLVPLAATLVGFGESLAINHLSLRRHPELLEHLRDLPSGFGNFLSMLRHIILLRYLEIAGRLSRAIFVNLYSSTVMIAVLFGIACIVLRPFFGRSETPCSGVGKGWRIALGFVSGLAGLFLLTMFVLVWGFAFEPKPDSFTINALFISMGFICSLLFWSFIYAVFLPAIDAAVRDRYLSFGKAVSQWDANFVPLLIFALALIAIEAVAQLSLYLPLFSIGSGMRGGLLQRMVRYEQSVLLALICFVPVVIVVRGERARRAFDECIGFWARHAKEAIVFVAVSAFILLIPEVLQDLSRNLLPRFGFAARSVSLLLSLLKAAVGVLVFCGLVVFYEKMEGVRKNEEQTEFSDS